MTVDELMAIEDMELRKYTLLSRTISSTREFKKIENDDYITYVELCITPRMDRNGNIYKKHRIDASVTYNKKAKRVFIRGCTDWNSSCWMKFLDDYILILPIVRYLKLRPTATLAKLVFQRKIKTIDDLVMYFKRSSLQRNDIPSKFVCTVMMHYHKCKMLSLLKDPENLESVSQLKFHSGVLEARIKYSVSDIERLNEIYNEWYDRQSLKVAAIKHIGGHPPGDLPW